ncbi:MAG: corrinoid protein [Candidatus Zixiibacteriota bacterium]|nr:MAG: corrinoid protein [candidate division Zixibacteria bacterium]
MELLDQLKDSLQKGDSEQVSRLTRQGIDEKIEVKIILDDGLIAGMNIVGTKFKEHMIFLPDVLLAAKAMYAGMDILKPLMIKEGIPTIGKVVIGTVHGDLHDIGKNLVGIMLKGAGFEVIDLGRDVPAEKFIEAAVEFEAKIIGMSALLTTTMPVMKRVIELAKEKEIYDRLKIIVGGAPLSEEYARQIGAHAYCYDGVNAVDRVKEFVKAK